MKSAWRQERILVYLVSPFQYYDEGALGGRLGAPSVNHLQMRNRRGEQCSPAARPESAQGTAGNRSIWRCAGAQCAPLRGRLYRTDRNGGRVVPQGTFSCGFAAIHLAAPCRIPVRNEYTMRPLSHNAHTPRGMRILCTY